MRARPGWDTGLCWLLCDELLIIILDDDRVVDLDIDLHIREGPVRSFDCVTIEYLVETVTPGITLLKGCKHPLDNIRPDSLIIRGVKPKYAAVARPRPSLLVKLIQVNLLIN